MLNKINDLSLRVKFMILFVIALLVIGLGMITILRSLLEQQLEGVYPTVRGMMIAQMVSHSLAKMPWTGNSTSKIQQTLNSYDSSYKDYGLSYILVQNEKNEPLATTLGAAIPPDLIKINELPQGKEIQNKRFKLGDKTIQDVAVPIGDPQQPKGIVRVGVLERSGSEGSWEVIKQGKIREVLNPIIWITLIGVVFLGSLFIFLFSKIVVQRIQYLIDVADKMSFGDLDVNVVMESKDELGVLGETLERTRVNLKDAIERLKKRKQ